MACRPKRDPDRYLPLPQARRRGLALCLSGGGYRAALFHLGVLCRLNQLGTLARVDTVSAVSGGSILAAFLAARIRSWPTQGPIAGFDEEFVPAFRDFTRKNIRTLWFLRRLLPWHLLDSTVAVESLVRRYHKDVISLPLSGLPERPRFIFSATDMTFGVNWQSSRDGVGSYQAGWVKPAPEWSAARAVAASSCFPPVFEPMPVHLEPERFNVGKAPDGEQRRRLIRGLRLSDGGVYDNMGLEPVWKSHAVVLVSDGGATFDHRPDAGVLGRLGRYQAIQGNQAGALRKRWLISSLERGDLDGVYLGIGSAASNFDRDAPGYREELVDRYVSEIRTDLDYFTEAEAKILQNHGYLLADVAMRCHGQRWVDPETPAARPPYPEWLDEADVARALAASSKRKILGRWRWLSPDARHTDRGHAKRMSMITGQ